MIGVTLDAHDLAVLDMRDERAHVGAIVRTNDSYGFHRTVSPKSENGRTLTEGRPRLALLFLGCPGFRCRRSDGCSRLAGRLGAGAGAEAVLEALHAAAAID